MKQINYSLYRQVIATAIFVTAFLGCNPQASEKESRSATTESSANLESSKSIPDSVIQYLVASAAKDFNEHQPPTAIDFRNVKAGYVSSGNEMTYLICGEFLSKEEKEWVEFVTIKTSKYEQYLGENVYCQKATFEKDGNNSLTDEIKSKLNELKK